MLFSSVNTLFLMAFNLTIAFLFSIGYDRVKACLNERLPWKLIEKAEEIRNTISK